LADGRWQRIHGGINLYENKHWSALLPDGAMPIPVRLVPADSVCVNAEYVKAANKLADSLNGYIGVFDSDEDTGPYFKMKAALKAYRAVAVPEVGK